MGAAADDLVGEKKRKFDPEGADYDYDGAKAAGLQPDDTGHWPSRDPSSGKLLKGRGHPTWRKTEEGEAAADHVIQKKSDGRYYSAPRR